MRILLATLGFTPKFVIPTLTTEKGVDRLVLYYGEHKNCDAAKDEVAKVCRKMKVDLKLRKMREFDFMYIATRMKADIEKYSQKHEIICFSISGGTKLMSAAAMMVSVIEGVRAVYVHEKTFDVVPLPLLQIPYTDNLTDMQRQILRLLHENGSTMKLSEIREGIGKHKSTTTHHIKELERKGVISLSNDEHDSRVKYVTMKESAALLVRFE